MRDPILFRRTDVLSPDESDYWKDLLYRVSKIGTEVEVAPPKGEARSRLETFLHDALGPSGSMENLGPFGVLDVTPEHSGLEVRFIGRQPHFEALHKQYSAIFAILQEGGARVRATCGLHFHLLTPTLAEPAPEIILANMWNLVRRYAPELRFLTSAGANRGALCRHRMYCSHLEMVRLSPGWMTMGKIAQELKDSPRTPEHQNFLNLEHLGFTTTGDILPLHLEFRFPDMHFSPLTVAAESLLFLGLLLKAVDLSQYGVVHVGKIVPWQRKVDLLDMLSNNDGDLATSGTGAVTDEVVSELSEGAEELLDLLAPVYDRIGHGAALEVLRALARRPISLLRSAGYSWEEIEGVLQEAMTADDVGLDDTDRRLMQGIELVEWSNLPSLEAWQWHAARELYLTPQELERRLQLLAKRRGVRWEPRLGTFMFTS